MESLYHPDNKKPIKIIPAEHLAVLEEHGVNPKELANKVNGISTLVGQILEEAWRKGHNYLRHSIVADLQYDKLKGKFTWGVLYGNGRKNESDLQYLNFSPNIAASDQIDRLAYDEERKRLVRQLGPHHEKTPPKDMPEDKLYSAKVRRLLAKTDIRLEPSDLLFSWTDDFVWNGNTDSGQEWIDMTREKVRAHYR